MITKVYGIIEGFSDRGVCLRVGGLVYEVMLMTVDRREMESTFLPGQPLELYTLHYIEGGVGGGNLVPVLIGFQKESDREFFQLFTKVEGIGTSNALRMLNAPIPRLARAIEDQDIKLLCTMKQVGDRTARKIVASMMGKMLPFLLVEDELPDGVPGGAGAEPVSKEEARWLRLREEAQIVLEQLGHSPNEARKLLDKAAEKQDSLQTLQDILDQVYGSK
ncbi:MAG: hypothetical protein HPY50_22545 [Firmicutes bacterium]|nr:hypothetical protein [Bacillota bacterium]